MKTPEKVASESTLFEFGPFRLDARHRALRHEGHLVVLTPKAFDALALLVRRHGQTVTKQALMDELWPDCHVEENNLHQQIGTIRRALGDVANGSRYIETVPRRGFCFVGTVKELPIELQASAETPRAAVIRRRWWMTTVAILTFGVGAALVLWSLGMGPQAPPRPAPPYSLAVLPFLMVGGTGGNDYLGVGMADALITRLGNLKDIAVRPTSAIDDYVDVARDHIGVGQKLGVDMILDGRMQRSQDRLRVTAQLVDVRSRATLWSGRFDEPLEDIFALQDAIAERLADSLEVELTADDRRRLARRQTANPAAYEAYLRGRYLWNRRTQPDIRKAIEYFERAIALDPKYAPAYVGLADCHANFNETTRAKAALETALGLDPMLAEAHASLGFVLYVDWDLAGAERELKRAVALGPNYSTAYHWYAYSLMTTGRLDAALAAIQRAQQLDPLSLIINTDVGEILYFAREYDRAIEQLESTLALDSNFMTAHYVLGRAYEAKGQHARAIEEYRRAMALSPQPGVTGVEGFLGHAYAVSGNKDEARALIARLKTRSSVVAQPASALPIASYDIGVIHAGLGETDQAFAWLRRACQHHSYSMLYLDVDPRLHHLHADPRYHELRRCVGFPP